MYRLTVIISAATLAFAGAGVLLLVNQRELNAPSLTRSLREHDPARAPRPSSQRPPIGERDAGAPSTWETLIAKPGVPDLDELTRGAAALDFDAARAWFEQLDNLQPEAWRERLRAVLLLRMTQADPAGTATFAAALRDADLRRNSLRQVFDTWSEIDAAEAATWLQKFKQPSRDELCDVVMATWSSADFERALSWTRNLPDDVTKERMLVHLSYEWLQREPREALNFAAGLPSASCQLVCTMASQWALRDPVSAAAWAQVQPDEARRVQVLGAVVAAWATQAPREAAVFAASLPAGEAQTAAAVSAISGWALSEPAAAARWVTFIPDSGGREQAMTQLFAGWGRSDAASAAEWLVNALDGPSKDVALDALSAVVADRYPAVALTFARAITDAGLRSRCLEAIERRGAGRSDEGAR